VFQTEAGGGGGAVWRQWFRPLSSSDSGDFKIIYQERTDQHLAQ